MMNLLKYAEDNTKKVTTYGLAGAVVVIFGANMISKWIQQRRYFKKLNIPGPSPKPLVGNMLEVMSKGFHEFDEEMIQKYGKICGYFEGGTPIILCTDVNLMKNFMIRDFNVFSGHRVFEAVLVEPMDRAISSLKGDDWKNVRSIVSAAFTVGKIKQMSKLMIDSANDILTHIDGLQESGGFFDPKEVFGAYTADVISCCAFGVKTDAINDPDSPFLKYLKKGFALSLLSPTLLLLFFAPKLAKYLAKEKYLHIFPKDTLKFFIELSQEVTRKRRSGEEKRDDFIQTMIEHEQNPDSFEDTEKEKIESVTGKWNQTKKCLTDNEILAQSYIFYLAGYETTATCLEFTAYNLALNPDCQDKLYSAIYHLFHEKGEVINYDMVNEIEYLDMVIKETLRMYPPALRADRVADEDYKYENFTFPKGSVLTIPIWAVHHDPSVYPEPYKFDPERFNSVEKLKRDNLQLIPFGAGPRNCVGMTFAMIEMKILLVKILLKYEICICDKTPIPLVLEKKHFLKSTKPIILKLKPRN